MPKFPPKTQTLQPILADTINEPEVAQVAASDVQAPIEIPKDLYDEAWVENSHRDFNTRLIAARAPVVKEPYKPAIAPQILETTRLEMEAGRARVADFAQIEAKRVAIPRKREPWEGTNTPVFRPDQFNEYAATVASKAQTVDKTALAQRS